MTKDLYWLALTLALTSLMWIPYVLNRLAVRGLARTLANPSPQDSALSAWAQRAQAAHANAIENLAVFAPAAIAVHMLGVNNAMTATACSVYFFARLTHFVVYAAGIPGLRTVAFFGGWLATASLVARILGLV